MKKSLLILCIVGIIIFILLLSFYVFVLSGAFAIFMSKPPEPQITYGEFPFTITYKVDNEIITYKDVIICEYEGIESWGTAGKIRKWSRKLKSGNEYLTLLRSKTSEGAFEVYMPIPGLPEYYMGDFRQDRKYYEKAMKDRRYLGYCQWDDDIIIKDISVSAEEVWEKYHIKIIDVTYPEPIENHFE